MRSSPCAGTASPSWSRELVRHWVATSRRRRRVLPAGRLTNGEATSDLAREQPAPLRPEQLGALHKEEGVRGGTPGVPTLKVAGRLEWRLRRRKRVAGRPSCLS